MKIRMITFAIIAALMFAATGCGSEENVSSVDNKIAVVSPSVSDVLEEKMNEADTVEQVVSTEESDDEILPSSEDGTTDETILSSIDGVDIDLTSLSSTLVYAQVYNMMYYPEDFVGKTIRMEGQYSDYLDEANGKHYFACIIMDATACCSQGIEFELTDDYQYPDSYPSEGEICTVEGVFTLYEEDGYTYCTLCDARLVQS